MPLPVKLSDALVLDARLEGELQQRSIAGQVEHWARLGKLLDAQLDGRARRQALQAGGSKPLSELVAAVGQPAGAQCLKKTLEELPFPHFAPSSEHPGLLIKTEADGSQSVGRFVDRVFVVAEGQKQPHAEVGVLRATLLSAKKNVHGTVAGRRQKKVAGVRQA
jgi:hypothetical protein